MVSDSTPTIDLAIRELAEAAMGEDPGDSLVRAKALAILAGLDTERLLELAKDVGLKSKDRLNE
jgi:hypothetical protein